MPPRKGSPSSKPGSAKSSPRPQSVDPQNPIKRVISQAGQYGVIKEYQSKKNQQKLNLALVLQSEDEYMKGKRFSFMGIEDSTGLREIAPVALEMNSAGVKKGNDEINRAIGKIPIMKGNFPEPDNVDSNLETISIEKPDIFGLARWTETPEQRKRKQAAR